MSATQALVPAVAELHETAPEKVRDVYLKAYRMVFFATIPLYAAILIALPLVSQLWINHLENQFMIFGAILAVGWGVNTLIGPAYFVNLGTGHLKWNSISHVLMAILNVLLGLLLGSRFGGLGVVIAAMVALVFASWFVIIALHKQYKIPFSLLLPSEHRLLLGLSVVCIELAVWVNSTPFFQQQTLLISGASIGFYLLVMGVVIWFHPYKNVLWVRFMNRKKI